VALIGDLPFVASPESVDVWSRQDEFVLDVSTGVPPDAFSADGQDWGLPFYDWPTIARSGYRSFRDRLRRMTALVDGVRVDHLVGLYRTYGRPHTGEAFFSPASESDQLAQGEALIALLKATGLELIAEDLGTVPDFVRASLERQGVAGCKILRWEREWRAPGQPFLDPATFPPESAAMTGTHDTETLSDWWRRAPADERAAAAALPVIGARLAGNISEVWDYRLRDAFIDLAFRARSNDVFLPVQDVFGWSDRINTPSTVGDANWTWRLPWPVDEWASVPDARERAAFSVNLAHMTGRGGG
jgi:4-alpha-glucanotransferase